LSYARPDQSRAENLIAALQSAGIEVWWDGLIEAGEAYSSLIEAALDEADAVIVLWSKSSVHSDWVLDEAARGRDRKCLAPLSIDGSEPPLGFRQYHTIDLSNWQGRADEPQFKAVLRCIAALGGKPHVTPRSLLDTPRSRRGVLAGSGAAALVAGGGLLAWQQGLFGGDQASANSVAVVPFANLGGDPAQSYFSDGLTEEIRAALARNDALRVLAATSSNTARAHKEDAVTTARRLGVAFLLEGSVRRANDVVRISAELIDGKTGFSRWSNSFDRKMSDVLTLQSEIARMVAEALSMRIGETDPLPGGTKNVEAYEAYLRGRELFNNASDEAADRAALAQYDLAIAADSRFARAHAARSRSLAAIASEYAKAAELRPLYDSAIDAAQRAVQIAPKMAEGHLALGYALFAGRLDVKAAAGPFDRAYALGQGDADILLLFALYCARAGRADQARSAVTRALALDPLNPRAYRAAGSIDYAARRYEAAMQPLKRALELKPDITQAHALIGSALLQLGKVEEARVEFLAEPSALFSLTGLAIAEKRLGNDAAAKEALARMIRELGDSSLYQQAEILAQWGEKEQAIAALERARAVGDSGLIYLATDPMLDPLRREPRFAALTKALAS
jgi:TolB-like protein/Flp pilus assembly protein TadD